MTIRQDVTAAVHALLDRGVTATRVSLNKDDGERLLDEAEIVPGLRSTPSQYLGLDVFETRDPAGLSFVEGRASDGLAYGQTLAGDALKPRLTGYPGATVALQLPLG